MTEGDKDKKLLDQNIIEKESPKDDDENANKDYEFDDQTQWFDMSVRFKIINGKIDELKTEVDTLAGNMSSMGDNISNLLWKMRNFPPRNNNGEYSVSRKTMTSSLPSGNNMDPSLQAQYELLIDESHPLHQSNADDALQGPTLTHDSRAQKFDDTRQQILFFSYFIILTSTLIWFFNFEEAAVSSESVLLHLSVITYIFNIIAAYFNVYCIKNRFEITPLVISVAPSFIVAAGYVVKIIKHSADEKHLSIWDSAEIISWTLLWMILGMVNLSLILTYNEYR